MLISKNLDSAIRVILNNRKITVRELAKEAGMSLGMSSRIANILESTGYVALKRGRGLQAMSWVRLLKAWAYATSVKEIGKIEFIAAERPQYLIKKIAGIAQKQKLSYAFTLLSATELIAPYISPNETHLYILESEKYEWQDLFRRENIFPAEKGNIICFIADKNRFFGSFVEKEINIISLPQLYADLFSFSGRLEEAAEELLKIMKEKAEKE